MTNLSPDQSLWRRRFSRGRLLQGAPLALGVIVAASALGLVGGPKLASILDQNKRIDDLKAKKASLPQLKLMRSQAAIELQQAQQQQNLLVELIAGQGAIETFLAQLSRESAATGVSITLYEPVPAVPSAPPANPANKRSKPGKRQANGKDPASTEDPLKKLGYQKTAVLLQAEAPYPGLLAFLRRMEQLELLVQPSDLELVALAETLQRSDDDDSKPAGPPRTRLKLKLNFFDKSSQPVKDREEQAPS